jgi:hypothetical protein
MPEVARDPKGMPPLDSVKAECERMGLSEDDALTLCDHWKSNGYRTGRNKVVDWKAVIRVWKRQKWFPSQKTSKDVSSDKRIRQLADLKELRRRYSGDGQNRLL